MIGKIPTAPPALNPIAPKDRVSRWNLVCSVKGPFGDPKPNEFGFWFNYFWEEVVTLDGITAVQQQKAAEVFFSVFQGAKAPFQVQPSFASRDDAFKENVLRQLLLIGFKRVALDAPNLRLRTPGSRSLAPAPLVAGDALDMNLFHLLGAAGEKVPIAFRADGRSWSELQAHKGFRTRARSSDSPIWKIFGIDKAWHPFNNPVYRNSLFLRLGSKNADNCLQTVISVGAEFSEITHFPILNDYVLVFSAKSGDGRYLALKPLDEWTAADEQTARSSSQKVRTVRGADGVIDHLEKDNFMYAFHMQGVKVFNTQAFFKTRGEGQKPTTFPERGAEEIPLENILCEIPFVQKWFYSWDDGQIMMYDIEFKPINWVPSLAQVDLLIGEKARLQLEAKIRSEITKSVNRKEFAVDRKKYNSFKADTRFQAKLLTGTERQDLYRLLNAYLKSSGVRPTTPVQEKEAMVAEKAAVTSLLLKSGGTKALVEKIAKTDQPVWRLFIREAKRLTPSKS